MDEQANGNATLGVSPIRSDSSRVSLSPHVKSVANLPQYVGC